MSEQTQLFYRQIIVSCDPNGGGISSDTAIISAYYEHGRMVICGIDAHPTKFDQKKKLLYAHLQALRQVPRFRFSEIVFVPENNLDDAANMLIETARTFENVRIYADKKSLQEGAKTKPWSKIKYTVSALHYLSPTDGTNQRLKNIIVFFPGCVYFDKELVCANPYAEHRETRANDTKKKLFHQLRQWKTLVYAGKTAKESVYITCSGKTDDSGRLVIGQKDDLAMAFVMNAYMNTQVNL